MKNINKFIFVILFVISFFVNFSKINALSYKSDFVYLEDSVAFYTDDFTIKLDYTVNKDSNEKSSISGYAFSEIEDIYYYHYIVYYYNLDKEEIGATDGYNGIGNSFTARGSYVNSFLEESSMYVGYELSDIVYYRIFIEPSSQEVVRNYLNNNIKLNENGIDDIVDFDTIKMNTKTFINVVEDYVSNYEYTINSYDIKIDVNENNTLNITEKIGAYFNVEKHGIFRKIPLRNEITRLDGTRSKNYAKISNLKVNDNYSLSNENGYKIIKIGDKNKTLTGQKNYEISYLYNLGKDTGKNYDELYFNLIGEDWDTSISNITFTIAMPKEFDSSKLGFSSGTVGSTDSSKITYNVDGNTIRGEYNGTLDSGDALTVRLELPEGYFVGASLNMPHNYYLMIIIPILGLLISFILWEKYGKDETIIETVEFYPPKGLNSADVGFIYRGKAEKKDVISLLIYLANKGYIKIEEIEEKKLFFTKKDFLIIKLKDYDGSNENERKFLDGLFFFSNSVDLEKAKEIMEQAKRNGKKIDLLKVLELSEDSTKTKVATKKELHDKFFYTMTDIISNMNYENNKNLIIEKNSKKKSFYIILLFIVALITIFLIPIFDYTQGDELEMMLLLFAFYMSFLIFGLFANISKFLRVLLLGGVLFHSFFLFSLLPIVSAIKDDYYYIIGFIIGIICVVGMILLYKIMPKRTEYGNEMLGKIKGLKKYLETVEKEKLEAMVIDNPTYFYDILPFAYVLGVSNKWIKKFEKISYQAPSWYDGYSSFSSKTFASFMNSTMSSVSSAMSTVPVSYGDGSGGGGSSGGGSSGGGSSGGGSGGGGGGSW